MRLEVKDFLLKPCSEAALRESVQRVTAGLVAQVSERTGVTLEQLYQAICQGETLDSARLQALLGAHIPRTVRLVRLNGVRPGALCWPGRWSVADAQRLLLGIAASGLLLFVITIALICLGTNVSYLA